jgi:integrase/recombinase XerD
MNSLQVNQSITALPTRGLAKGYQADISIFNRWAGGRQITADLVAEYFNQARTRYQVTTINRHKAAVKKAVIQALGHGATIGQLGQLDTFFKGIKGGTPDRKVLQEMILTPDELHDLIQYSGEKTALIIKALYVTACRVSELTHIKLDNCDTRADAVLISVTGKGRKDRTVYMDRGTFDAIRTAYQGTDYLFESNGKPLHTVTVHTLIKRAGARIGRPDIHAHTLRHTFATHRLNDLGISAVSEYLGHSSPEITAKYYLHNKPTVKSVLEGLAI